MSITEYCFQLFYIQTTKKQSLCLDNDRSITEISDSLVVIKVAPNTCKLHFYTETGYVGNLVLYLVFE